MTSLPEVPPPPGLVERLAGSWVVRSLGVGAVATALDIALGSASLLLGAPTRFAAMLGTLVGAAFAFVFNRRFAFKDHSTGFSGSAVRYTVVSLLSSALHGQLVVVLRDQHAVPYVIAKIASDLAILTVSQLFLLRYVVFPKAKPGSPPSPPPGSGEPPPSP